MTATVRRTLGAAVVAMVALVLWAQPGSAMAASASAFELPANSELSALTVGPGGGAYAAVERYDEPLGGVPLGFRIATIEADGSIAEFPATISKRAPIVNAGIAWGPAGSVWVPTGRDLTLVGPSGVEKKASLGKGEVADIVTDRHGGAWVLDGQHLVHVEAAGKIRRFAFGYRPAAKGCCGLPANLVVDGRGDVWFTVVRGGLQQTREVVERRPGGSFEAFPVGARFTHSEAIGVAGGRPIVRSGHKFLELDPRTGKSRRLAVPDEPCSMTEAAEIWCQGKKTISRWGAAPSASVAFPPGFRLYEVAGGAGGELWYGAEDRPPCGAGASTCVNRLLKTVVVGQIPVPGAAVP
jgi:streptogramin lyase